MVLEKPRIEKRKQINASAMYFTLSELLRSEDRYCDVNLQVGNKSFRSSRLLLAAFSEYFSTMFYGSTFTESNIISESKPLVLRDLDTASFENVLNFMYTGDVDVTDNNVFELLCTCDFLILRMSHIEERCVQHFQNSAGAIARAMEIFAFACMRKKTDLIDALREHIFRFLNHFSEDSAFMEISYNELSILLKCENIPSRNGNRLLNTVIRWIHHAREERGIYREELMKMIDFARVSPQYVLFMLNEYENIIDRVLPIVDTNKNIAFIGNYCPDIEDNSEETLAEACRKRQERYRAIRLGTDSPASVEISDEQVNGPGPFARRRSQSLRLAALLDDEWEDDS